MKTLLAIILSLTLILGVTCIAYAGTGSGGNTQAGVSINAKPQRVAGDGSIAKPVGKMYLYFSGSYRDNAGKLKSYSLTGKTKSGVNSISDIIVPTVSGYQFNSTQNLSGYYNSVKFASCSAKAP